MQRMIYESCKKKDGGTSKNREVWAYTVKRPRLLHNHNKGVM
jgi:hypothetical protein